MRFLITQLNGDREKFRLRYWLANIHITSHLIRNHFCSWSFYVPRSLSIFTARASCYTISAAVYYTFLEHDQNSLSHSTDHRVQNYRENGGENNYFLKTTNEVFVVRSTDKKKRKFSLSFSAHPEASNAASLLPTTFETAKIVGSSAYRKYFCD